MPLKVYQTMELLSKDSHVKLHQTNIRPVNLLFILRILLSTTVLQRLTSWNIHKCASLLPAVSTASELQITVFFN